VTTSITLLWAISPGWWIEWARLGSWVAGPGLVCVCVCVIQTGSNVNWIAVNNRWYQVKGWDPTHES
jgi:hypothetical protein